MGGTSSAQIVAEATEPPSRGGDEFDGSELPGQALVAAVEVARRAIDRGLG